MQGREPDPEGNRNSLENLSSGGLKITEVTPNGRLTRVQQDAFIDPDHKVEYTYPELRDPLTGAGFEIATAKGLNLGQRSMATGVFDGDEVAGHSGLLDEIEDCYILCGVAREPV
jgi:hypothetical protein